MYGQEYLEAVDRKKRDDALRAEALAVLDGLRPEVKAKIGEILDAEKRQEELRREHQRMMLASQQQNSAAFHPDPSWLASQRPGFPGALMFGL